MNETRVMLLGDIDIRDQARTALHGLRHVEIVGELAGFERRHIRFVEEIAPDVVVVDGAAFDIDASSTIATLRASGSVDRIVAVVADDRSVAMLIEAGAHAVVSTQEELRTAVAGVVLSIPEMAHFQYAA